ncbi:MAG: SpaA isopeptide-forming pilin-related protein [Thermomicrobiales bacterium]
MNLTIPCQPCQRTAVFLARLAAILPLLLAGWLGAVTSASAQGGSSDVAILTTENGQPAYDACYVLVGYSEVGCDENADGKVMFAQVPWGTYTVHQTANLGAGRTVNDFTIEVRGNINSAGFEGFAAVILTTGGSSTSSRPGATSDIAIVTTENGRSVTDACYILVDYSDVGCDENGDGKITFQNVPYGTYSVVQVADLGPGRTVPDFTIRVTGAASADGWERFTAIVVTTGSGSSSGVARDISLITRDPDSGALLSGTCYTLLDFSNEGCDENGDGQVTFAAVPPGTYTVHQTRTPAGYPSVNDFPITVDRAFPDVPVGFLVKQAPEQNRGGTRNVTFAFVDSRTETKVVPAQVCIRIGTVSEVGCDEDLVDGQIDFLDVETGTHALTFSNLPAGWQILGDDRNGPSVTIERGAGPQLVYIGVFTGSTGSSGGSGTTAATSSSTTCTAAGGRSCQVAGVGVTCDPAAACSGGSITATSQDGEVLGRCVMDGNVQDTSHPFGCSIRFNQPIDRGAIVVLTIDGIAPGYVAEQNPMSFDTTNVGTASHDTGFTLIPTGGSTTVGSPGHDVANAPLAIRNVMGPEACALR